MADFDNADFTAAWKGLVTSSEFFPSLAKIADAVSVAARTRFLAKEREEREERLAIQAGESKIMDPKSEVHRVIVGPNHQRFLDILSGKVPLPAPSWEIKPRAKGEAA